jgi:hypothetical protein
MFTLVARLPQDLVPTRNDGPDRDIAVLGRPLREAEGASHHPLVGRGLGHALSIP